MSEELKAPEIIYLVPDGCDAISGEQLFSWCEDKITDEDIQYTRTEDKQAEQLEKIIAELGEQSERYENDAKKYSDMCDEEFSRAEKLLVENLEQAERIKELEQQLL